MQNDCFNIQCSIKSASKYSRSPQCCCNSKSRVGVTNTVLVVGIDSHRVMFYIHICRINNTICIIKIQWWQTENQCSLMIPDKRQEDNLCRGPLTRARMKAPGI